MGTKYQIFISSTYDDLREQRDQVIRALLEMGHIPVGMEMFSAADETQWKIIARQIEECDYYVVIIAHRYGSLAGEISYTEKEYDYADSVGVPVIGFVIDETASWPNNLRDLDEKKQTALRNFKNKIQSRMVSFWDNKEDLYGKVAIALMKLFQTNPRPGWARASAVINPELTNELSRLSSENASLRDRLRHDQRQEEEYEVREAESIIQILLKNTWELSIYYLDSKDWELGRKISLYQLFNIIAPEMMIEKSILDLCSYIGLMTKAKARKLRKNYPVPSNTTKARLVDFMSLGLVAPSGKKHAVKDNNEYWCLTPLGQKIYFRIRRNELDKINVKEGRQTAKP